MYVICMNGYSLLFFMCARSAMVFVTLIRGWSSNSKYSLLGRLRGVAQRISYEAVLRTLVLFIFSITQSFSIYGASFNSSLLLSILGGIWMVCFLAETHRAPFDFSEAESELVSGFNTEYSGSLFAFLFLSEYIIILFGCILFSMLFVSGPIGLQSCSYVVYPVAILITYVVIWVRITFCRYRYDQLIHLA